MLYGEMLSVTRKPIPGRSTAALWPLTAVWLALRAGSRIWVSPHSPFQDSAAYYANSIAYGKNYESLEKLPKVHFFPCVAMND